MSDGRAGKGVDSQTVRLMVRVGGAPANNWSSVISYLHVYQIPLVKIEKFFETCWKGSCWFPDWNRMTKWLFPVPKQGTWGLCWDHRCFRSTFLHHDSCPNCGPFRALSHTPTQSYCLHWWCNCTQGGTCRRPKPDQSHCFVWGPRHRGLGPLASTHGPNGRDGPMSGPNIPDFLWLATDKRTLSSPL